MLVACLAVVGLVGQAAPAGAASPAIGTVVRATGAVTARAGDGDLRILGEGAPVFETDVLTTGGNSTAVIGLTDGSRITVRPDTIVVLEEYAHGAEKESTLMRLFKGGLRALTGLISRRNPENGFRLHTATAVVGVRGTEFDAWMCEGECADTLAQTETAGSAASARVAGRVVRLKGKVTATAENGTRRVLLKNGPVHPGDVIETQDGGFAVVVFRDNSRVTLRSGTRFQVERYAFEQGADDGVLFRLLKGGVRFLTGLMAKRNPESFRIGTPTAVVGVRGTGGQILLSDILNAWGVTRQVLQAAGFEPPGDEFVIFMVTLGSIVLDNDAGESTVFSGQAVIVLGFAEAALDISGIQAIIDRIAAHEGGRADSGIRRGPGGAVPGNGRKRRRGGARGGGAGKGPPGASARGGRAGPAVCRRRGHCHRNVRVPAGTAARGL